MKRIVLDIVLWVLLFYLTAFRLLPRKPHEALGILMPLLTLLHLVWNRTWFSSISRGKWNFNRVLFVFVNIGLLVSFVVATVSGLAVAHRLFHGIFGLAWQKSIFVRQIHIASGYWVLIFTGLHLGLHWQSLWTRFVRFCGWDVSKRGYRAACRAAIFAIVAGGVYGSFLNRIGDRLMMVELVRQSAATKLPVYLFLLVLLSIFSLYAVIGHSFALLAQRKRS